MTEKVPEYMKGWCPEETTQEQYDWLYDMSMELRNLEQVISPLLSRAWDVMSALQSVVDENQDWTEDIQTNTLDTSYLYCYANGTIEIMREIKRSFGTWTPAEDEKE